MLFFTLSLFISIVNTVINQTIVHMQSEFEFLNRLSLERFSLLESHVLIKTVKHLHEYKTEDLNFEFKEGNVHVSIIDETAYLYFNFEKSIYARLDYDLVFDSSINYIYIDESEYLLIDKNAD